MRKHTIIGVIVLMSISLLGVVGVQLYWINNAIIVKQQLFEREVHDALAKVVDKLETREAVSVVTDQLALSSKQDTLAPTRKDALPVKTQETKTALAKTPAVQLISKKTEAGKPQKPVRFQVSETYTVEPALSQRFYTLIDSFNYHPVATLPAQVGTRFLLADSLVKNPAFKRVYTAAHDTSVFRKLSRNLPHLSQRAVALSNVGKDHKIFRISADTLRHLAFELDSLRTADLSSIRVKNDSIYIYERGIAGTVSVFRATKNFESPGFAKHNDIRKGKKNAPFKINSIRVSPVTVLKETPELASEKQLQETASKKIEVKKEKLNDVVQKMMVEYVVRDVPLKERLNEANLQNLLTDELRENGIDLDFGYHVVSADKDTLVDTRVGNAATANQDTHYYAAFLFPNDIIEKPDYLAVYFPDTKMFALKSLAGMMSLSALFTLIIIATFATTIHIIYKQKRLSDMKNDFINNMTHEFKTPIATISLATDSIFNPKVFGNPEKIRYYTNIIKEENKRMNAQVENVLQIALLEKNEFKLNLQPVDVHLLILKAIESIRIQVEQRMGQILINLNAPDHELQTDEIHLFNVICNLLDNANKYSPTTPEIEIVTQSINGGLQIAVADKGIGMSKDTQQRVFEKFYRVPTGNLHNVKGFGLGLSYVKAIVEAHNGSISLWSEPGKGSRFELFLPFRN